MPTVDNDWPCVCTHPLGAHVAPFVNPHDNRDVIMFHFCNREGCKCDEFKADNLRYLEQLEDVG